MIADTKMECLIRFSNAYVASFEPSVEIFPCQHSSPLLYYFQNDLEGVLDWVISKSALRFSLG